MILLILHPPFKIHCPLPPFSGFQRLVHPPRLMSNATIYSLPPGDLLWPVEVILETPLKLQLTKESILCCLCLSYLS